MKGAGRSGAGRSGAGRSGAGRFGGGNSLVIDDSTSGDCRELNEEHFTTIQVHMTCMCLPNTTRAISFCHVYKRGCNNNSHSET